MTKVSTSYSLKIRRFVIWTDTPRPSAAQKFLSGKASMVQVLAKAA